MSSGLRIITPRRSTLSQTLEKKLKERVRQHLWDAQQEGRRPVGTDGLATLRNGKMALWQFRPPFPVAAGAYLCSV